MGKWCLHASSFIFDQIVFKVAGNQDRHKSSDEFDFGPLVSMAHLYVFEMRFDLGTLDSGERSLPFGLLVMNSWLKVLPKRFKCSILVWNYSDNLNVPWSNHWSHLLCWRHLLCWHNAFSAHDIRWAVADCGIFSAPVPAFCCFKCYLGSFSRCKTEFSPNIIPP